MDKTIENGEGESLLLTSVKEASQTNDDQLTTETVEELVRLNTGLAMEKTNAKKLPQFIASSAVNLAAIAAGIALGWPSPANSKLGKADETPLDFVTNPEQESWIGSLVALGATFGPLVAGVLCDKLGRKMTLLISSAPFIISWFIISTTCNIVQIYVSRFLMGCGVGAIFTALPIYIGEIADDSMRGALGSFLQLFITMGLLLAYVIGPFVSFFWLAVVCFIFPVAFVICFSFFPDSPTFLLAQGQKEEAKAALKKLRGLEGSALDKEVQLIQKNVDEAMKNKGSFKDITKNKGNLKALLLSLGLVAGQQLSGINVILFFTEKIFAATGSDMSPATSTIIIGVVQVLSSGVTPMVVERLGRRLLLLISAVGMCISLISLGTFFYMKDNGTNMDNVGFLPVASLVLYMIVYCIGFGPIPWAVMGELFPANIKSSASTATASFCWFVGFLITKFFSNLEQIIGMAGAFWLFSGFCVIAGLFVFKFLPETKGKSVEEIQEELNR